MKLCLGCMNPIHDRREICSYCEYRQREGVKSAFHLIPGTVLKQGTYTLGKVLGSGGFGVTYIAWDNSNNRKIVIKEYVPEQLCARSHGKPFLKPVSPAAKEQFRAGKENFMAAAGAMCENGETEYVENYYDCFEENGTAYSVMEYLNGLTLQEVLQQSGNLRFASAGRIICDVLSGLEALHGDGILHMDIAPSNIFITTEDKIKILDVGTYRYTSGSFKSLSAFAREGFAAEELYRSNGELGTWTDVYACGAVMYQMITGMQPPPAIQRAAEDKIVPLEEYVKLQPNTENAIYNSLVVSARKRTETAKEFREALLGSQKVTKIVETKKKKGKSIGKIAAAAAVLCLVAGSGFFAVWSQMKKAPLENAVNAVQGNLRVPNLEGMDEEKARAELAGMGLDMEVIEVNYSESVPKGKITAQIPEGGGKIADGGIVQVKRSGGTEEVMLPKLTGESRKKAEDWLKGQSMQKLVTWSDDVEDDSLYSDKQEEGTILSQKPEAGKLFALASGKLELSVCQGNLNEKTDELLVPDLSGYLPEDAKKEILANTKGEQGYTFSLADGEGEISEEFSWEYISGAIMKQSPAAGETARTNKRIHITVARELQETTIPDIVGKSLEEAKAALEEAHIKCKTAGAYSDGVAVGKVMGITYKSGKAAEVGETMMEKDMLTVTYSQGSRPALPPSSINGFSNPDKKPNEDPKGNLN